MKQKKVPGYQNLTIRKEDILGLVCCWFIFGLVTLPSAELYFQLGMANVLKLLKIEIRDSLNLPSILMYNQMAGGIQWNNPVPKCDRLDHYGKEAFLYLIRPLLSIIQTNFPKAWIPSIPLTVDELSLIHI